MKIKNKHPELSDALAAGLAAFAVHDVQPVFKRRPVHVRCGADTRVKVQRLRGLWVCTVEQYPYQQMLPGVE